MDKKKLMLLIGALIVAIGTALAARSMFTGAPAPQAQASQPQIVSGPKVLVAQRALPAGTIITLDAMSFQAWPRDMVQDAYYIDGEADVGKLIGTVVRFPITAGQPVTQGALVSPGDRGFLAAALGAGLRAITISVSAKTGVGGFIFPGDRVDLVLTQTVDSEGSEGPPLKTAETILRNIRVLATDQSTETEKVDGKTVVRAFSTVTLEVTPRIAEKVAVAQTLGTLTLSLRSIADNQSELERAVASGDVKVPEGATREEEELLLRKAISNPIETRSSFVTGGDVSRYQRRTVPTPQRQSQSGGGGFTSASASGLAVSPFRSGPVIRVTRGKDTSAVPVGK